MSSSHTSVGTCIHPFLVGGAGCVCVSIHRKAWVHTASLRGTGSCWCKCQCSAGRRPIRVVPSVAHAATASSSMEIQITKQQKVYLHGTSTARPHRPGTSSLRCPRDADHRHASSSPSRQAIRSRRDVSCQDETIWLVSHRVSRQPAERRPRLLFWL